MFNNNKRKIDATPNYSKRTFTLRITFPDGVKWKYRTFPMVEEEFNSCLHHTRSDWEVWLMSDEFEVIKQ